MASRNTMVGVAALAVVCTLVGVAIGAAVNLRDPEESIGVVQISTGEHDGPTTPGAGVNRQVAGLDEVTGMVGYHPGRADLNDLVVGRVQLEFGPLKWIERAGPRDDYDGDGSVEALRDELAGLVGTEGLFLVRLDDDGDEGSVYTINGLPYRDPASPAPWLDAGPGRTLLTEDEILRLAAKAVGENALVTELEADDDDPVAWEAEVVDAEGQEYDVELDATGTVLSVRRD